MKIIYNKIIPFPGYKAINLFGILFARKNAKIDLKTINHESIHTTLMKEMLYIPFYIWYLIEYIILLIKKDKNPYRNIRFEKEAYLYQDDDEYLKHRTHFVWASL